MHTTSSVNMPLMTRKKPEERPGSRLKREGRRGRDERDSGRVGSSRSAGLRGKAPVARPLKSTGRRVLIG
jgi:hypothetical protein